MSCKTGHVIIWLVWVLFPISSSDEIYGGWTSRIMANPQITRVLSFRKLRELRVLTMQSFLSVVSWCYSTTFLLPVLLVSHVLSTKLVLPLREVVRILYLSFEFMNFTRICSGVALFSWAQPENQWALSIGGIRSLFRGNSLLMICIFSFLHIFPFSVFVIPITYSKSLRSFFQLYFSNIFIFLSFCLCFLETTFCKVI